MVNNVENLTEVLETEIDVWAFVHCLGNMFTALNRVEDVIDNSRAHVVLRRGAATALVVKRFRLY